MDKQKRSSKQQLEEEEADKDKQGVCEREKNEREGGERRKKSPVQDRQHTIDDCKLGQRKRDFLERRKYYGKVYTPNICNI